MIRLRRWGVAVLLMAYGTPRHPDEVEAYFYGGRSALTRFTD